MKGRYTKSVFALEVQINSFNLNGVTQNEN